MKTISITTIALCIISVSNAFPQAKIHFSKALLSSSSPTTTKVYMKNNCYEDITITIAYYNKQRLQVKDKTIRAGSTFVNPKLIIKELNDVSFFLRGKSDNFQFSGQDLCINQECFGEVPVDGDFVYNLSCDNDTNEPMNANVQDNNDSYNSRKEHGNDSSKTVVDNGADTVPFSTTFTPTRRLRGDVTTTRATTTTTEIAAAAAVLE